MQQVVMGGQQPLQTSPQVPSAFGSLGVCFLQEFSVVSSLSIFPHVLFFLIPHKSLMVVLFEWWGTGSEVEQHHQEHGMTSETPGLDPVLVLCKDNFLSKKALDSANSLGKLF